jgi:hypothetical protein
VGAFAALESQLGPAIVQALANSWVVIAPLPAFEAVFTRRPVEGLERMRGHEVTLSCATASLDDSVLAGTPVEVFRDEALTLNASPVPLKVRSRTDDPQTGDTWLELEQDRQ